MRPATRLAMAASNRRLRQAQPCGGRAWHLVRRFGGGLWPGGPAAAAVGWATSILSPGELELWVRMSGPDRRHSIAVARRVERAGRDGVAGRVDIAGPVHPPRGGGVAGAGTFSTTDPRLTAAALLHDVGKLQAGLGTFARVVATVAALALGRSRVASLAGWRGIVGRMGRYLAHDRLGAELLASVGSDPLVVAWAAEHHLPAPRWTIPPGAGRLLKAADDD